MGACEFIHSVVGYSASEEFDKLVAAAEYDDGHEGYNGTISTCTLGRITKFSDICTPAVEKKAYKHIRERGCGEKWVANVLDLGVVGYEQISVKKCAPSGHKPAKYQQRFVVYKWHNIANCEKYVEDFATKPEADAYAAKMTLKDPNTEYTVRKRPIIVNGGNDAVTIFTIEKRELKTRPKTVKAGAVLKEKHKYVFYGLASE